MTFSEIQQYHNDILQLVLSRRLRDALIIVNKIAVHVNSSDVQNRYQSLSDTFRNMLKYSFELAPDPEREKILIKLQQSILELTDDIRELWIRSMNLFDRKLILDRVSHFEASYLLDDEGLTSILMHLSSDFTEENNPEIQLSKDEFRTQLFYYFWLKGKWNGKSKSLLLEILNQQELSDNLKSQLVSASTMSLLRHFDSQNMILHFELSQHTNLEIRQRALIGLFLSMLIHQKRIPLYPEITDRLKSIPDDKTFQERLLAVIIQFIRASETEKITRKIQEEIVPEVLKIKNELEDKLNLDDLLSKDNFEDKNPEWESFLKDSPDVYQKLEQFSKMQIEGADVFMGAFAMLKHFSFFKELPNWFIPFSAKSTVVKNAFEGISDDLDVPAFTDGLEQSTVLCNSDKYSFCLNMQHMPAEQRKMMLELFNMELKAMNEMMEDEYKLNTEAKSKILNTQYLQDLYRFFKLHPSRKEYPSVFEVELDVLESEVFRSIFEDSKEIKNLSEFYFSGNKFAEAMKLFNWLSEKESSFELFEKMGFCSQKQGDFQEAIKFYQKAELFDKDKVWLQKKLGYCFRKTGDSQRAIEYYKEVIKTEPKDLNNLAYLGQLHIDIEDFESALHYYYQVEYQGPENTKVYRPIAWCSFVLGRNETAIKYFEKVIENKPGKSDYLNLGHAYWVEGKLVQALDAYREAIRLSGRNEDWFRDTFVKDSKYLISAGLNELDIMLMVDYVLI